MCLVYLPRFFCCMCKERRFYYENTVRSTVAVLSSANVEIEGLTQHRVCRHAFATSSSAHISLGALLMIGRNSTLNAISYRRDPNIDLCGSYRFRFLYSLPCRVLFCKGLLANSDVRDDTCSSSGLPCVHILQLS